MQGNTCKQRIELRKHPSVCSSLMSEMSSITCAGQRGGGIERKYYVQQAANGLHSQQRIIKKALMGQQKEIIILFVQRQETVGWRRQKARRLHDWRWRFVVVNVRVKRLIHTVDVDVFHDPSPPPLTAKVARVVQLLAHRVGLASSTQVERTRRHQTGTGECLEPELRERVHF